MLVLTRKSRESIIIGNDVRVTVLEVRGTQVRLGIEAPRNMPVNRAEIFEIILQENMNASKAPADLGQFPELPKSAE